MEDKIEVNEFVRTKDGIIDRVIIEYKGKCNNPNCNYKHVSCEKNYYNEEDIIKHSKNIIDLLEYLDLIKIKGKINTTRDSIFEDKEMVFLDAQFIQGFTEIEKEGKFVVIDLDYLINVKDLTNDKIDWILTHEQIKENCYKV